MSIMSTQSKKKVHIADTAFVIGSGPSLKNVDMSLLKGLDTFSMNRQYIAYEDWGFYPKFYTLIDDKLGDTIHKDIYDLMMNPECSIQHYLMRGPGYAHLRDLLGGPRGIAKHKKKFGFWNLGEAVTNSNGAVDKTVDPLEWGKITEREINAGDLSELVKLYPPFDGNCGSYTTSLAFYLGYRRVVLLGVDGNCTGRDESVEKGYDVEHFHPEYFDPKKFVHGQTQGFADDHSFLGHWFRMKHGNDLRATKNGDPTAERAMDQLCANPNFEIISASEGSLLNKGQSIPKTIKYGDIVEDWGGIFDYISLEDILEHHTLWD